MSCRESPDAGHVAPPPLGMEEMSYQHRRGPAASAGARRVPGCTREKWQLRAVSSGA